MNEHVKKEDSLYRLLLDSNIDAIIVFNPEMIILEWNRMAEQVYGKLREEVIGKSFIEAIPALSVDQETLGAISLAMKQVKSFVPALSQIPHRAQIENHYIPLTYKTGFLGVMNVGHDVAHRIKAEVQLEALNHKLKTQYHHLEQTTAELASLTSLSSQEIKQPIRQIYTAIENLIKAEAMRLSDTGKAAFRRIQSSLNRMNLQLDDMMNLTSISMLNVPRQAVNLGIILEQAVGGLQNMIKDKGIKVTWGSMCTVQGHVEQLRLLFHHLLATMINFIENREPTISVSCNTINMSRFPEVQYSERDYYRVTLADNAAGSDQNNAAEMLTLFEKFQTDRKRRLTTGLVIASKIMDVHEGFMYAENKPDAGIFFHCFFPVNNE